MAFDVDPDSRMRGWLVQSLHGEAISPTQLHSVLFRKMSLYLPLGVKQDTLPFSWSRVAVWFI